MKKKKITKKSLEKVSGGIPRMPTFPEHFVPFVQSTEHQPDEQNTNKTSPFIKIDTLENKEIKAVSDIPNNKND